MLSGTDPRANNQATRDWNAAENAAAADRARRRWSLGDVKDHVALAAAEVGQRFNIGTIGGWGTRPNPTDHDDGLALDYMVTGQRGTRLADYLIENGKRLGVTYLIWQQRINSLDGKGWQQMEDRGSSTANHMDHVHASFTKAPGDPNAPARPPHHRPAGRGGGTTTAQLQDTLTKVAVTGLFVLAGAGLIVLGLRSTVQPVTKAATEAATGAATKAASVVPQGKAATTAMKGMK